MCRRAEFGQAEAGAKQVEGAAFRQGRAGFEQELPGGGECGDECGGGYLFFGWLETKTPSLLFVIAGLPVTAGLTGNLHENCAFAVEPRLLDQQQFLAFAIALNDVQFLDTVEFAEQQADVCHGGEFEHQAASAIQNDILQCQHIRRAIFREEDLPSAGAAPGRVDEYQVWPEGFQQAGQRFGRDADVAEFHVITSQARQIRLRRLQQQRIHLVVQHCLCHLRKLPAVNSQPAC